MRWARPSRPELEGVDDCASSGFPEIVHEAVLLEHGGHLDYDVSFLPVEEEEAHFQRGADHVMQLRNAAADDDGNRVDDAVERAGAPPSLTHPEVERNTGQAAHRHGSVSHDLESRHHAVPHGEFRGARTDPGLRFFGAERRRTDILVNADVAAAPVAHLWIVDPSQQYIARQILTVGPAFRDGVRQFRLKGHGRVSTRIKGTQADTTMRIRAGRRRRLLWSIECDTVRCRDQRSGSHLFRVEGTRPGSHVGKGSFEEASRFSVRLGATEQQRTFRCEQGIGGDTFDAGRIAVEKKVGPSTNGIIDSGEMNPGVHFHLDSYRPVAVGHEVVPIAILRFDRERPEPFGNAQEKCAGDRPCLAKHIGVLCGLSRRTYPCAHCEARVSGDRPGRQGAGVPHAVHLQAVACPSGPVFNGQGHATDGSFRTREGPDVRGAELVRGVTGTKRSYQDAGEDYRDGSRPAGTRRQLRGRIHARIVAPCGIRTGPGGIHPVCGKHPSIDTALRAPQQCLMGVSVLGPVHVDGAPRLAPREQIVLSVLALRNGEVTSTGTLADAIWADDLPGTWRKQLQASVGVIRRAVGSERIETSANGYRLQLEDDDLDISRFENQIGRGRMHLDSGQPGRAVAELRRSLAIAPTDPFPALHGWRGAADEIARILELRHGVEDDLLRARLAAGDHPTVAADAARAVAAEPLREARWWALALAQYRSGRQGEAMVTLRRVRALLADELGADPGAELQALEKAILQQDPELLDVPATQDGDDLCPYPGLAPFGIEDAERFFGRETDITATVERLTRDGFCVVSGPSGCGKSSLLRAGVAPIFLSRGDLVTITTPARSLPALSVGDGSRHLLIIDQFEEAFAAAAPVAAEEYCAGVSRQLHEGHRVAIVVRSDLLDACATQPGIAPLMATGLQMLTAPAAAALTAAIEEPARQAALTFEAGLVDLMVSETVAHTGGLPLLAHALAETWARREGSTLTLEAYQGTGGLSGSISRTAERLYLSLTEPDRQGCRLLLLRLISITTGDSIVHRPLPLRALTGDRSLEGLVGRLAAARLLTVEADMVSLSHEAISRAWPRLHDWLEVDREAQRVLEHLSRAAVGWAESGESDDELYRGARLVAARELHEEKPGSLTRTESRFVRASIEGADRGEREHRERAVNDARQNVRLRRLLRTVAGVLGVAVIAGILAVNGAVEASRRSEESRGAQQEAQLEAMVGQSSALRTSARDLATLLAVEAYRRWPDDARVQSALLGVFSTEPGFLGYQRIPGVDRLIAAALPDGTGAAVLLGDGNIARYDFKRAAMSQPIGASADERSTVNTAVVGLSADGQRLVAAVPGDGAVCGSESHCTLVSAFDLSQGTRVLTPTAIDATGGELVVDSTGRFAALADAGTGSVSILDLSNGKLRSRIDNQTDPDRPRTVSIAFSASGKLIIGSSDGVLRIANPATGSIASKVQAGPGTVDVQLVNAGGGLVVGAGNDGLAAVDLEESRVVWNTGFTSSHPEPCPWLAASATSGTAYCGDHFGKIEERSMIDGGLTGARFDPQRGDVGELMVSADGRTLVSVGASEPVITRWRLDGSGPVATLIAEGQVNLDRYDSSGSRLVTATRTQGSRRGDELSDYSIWDANADSRLRRMRMIEGAGWVAPNVIAAYLPEDEALGYLDAVTGERVAGDEVPLDALNLWPAASGDRLHVLFADGTIWTIATATMTRIEPTLRVDGEPRSISTDTAGHVLVSSLAPEGPVMTLMDGLTGETLIDAVPGGEVSVLAPDGTVFGSNARGQITHYDAQLRALRTLAGARGEISMLQVSDDGRVLMAAANDQTVSVYDTDTGIRLGSPLPAEAPFISPGVLRPDGRAVAVNSKAGIIIWDLDPRLHVDQACLLAGRNLTRTEWENYLGALGQWRATCPEFD